MGHIRLPTLPKTRKWEHVVGLIAGGADVERIAAASADAAEHGLERASQDQGLARAFWLLTQFPQAARQSDFSDQLKRLGLEVSSKPTLLEIVGAFTNAVDRYVRTRGNRSDLGEMAQHAAAETLTTLVGRELPGLFGPSAGDVHARKNERSVTGLRKSKLCKMAANISFKFCFKAECFGDATLFHKFLIK
jgi:hypothetical protein